MDLRTNIIDIVLLVPLLACMIYGFLKGMRAILWLLVFLLVAMLVDIILLYPMEKLLLDISGIGSKNYPDAPAVAVFILENRMGFAYVASLLPTWFVITLCLFRFIARRIFRRKPSPYKAEMKGRLLALPLGLICGFIICIFITVQMIRLPWSAAGSFVSDSRVIDWFNRNMPSILSVLAGKI